MSKYMVTLHLTQYAIVEANNEQEALEIADCEANDDDWSNQSVILPLTAEPYHGTEKAFNDENAI